MAIWTRRGALAGLGAAAALSRAPGAWAAPEPAVGTVRFEAAHLIQGGWARGRLLVSGAARLELDGVAVPLDAQQRFFIAFDRDAAPRAELRVTLPGGEVLPRGLEIARRDWRIEHVDVVPHPEGMPDAEFLALRKGELARIAAARALDTGAQGWRQDMTWPARGRLSGHFGAQRVYRGGVAGAFHTGADIAGGAGAPIMAPADGVVVLAAEVPFTLEGHLLMLDHGMGLNSALLHCSQLLVREGQTVRQGEVIARIGMTGRATGPHLHWGLKWREARLDPELFVNEAVVS